VITALCDGLAAMLGAAETFSCDPISGVIYFRASELAVPPVKQGVIPSTVVGEKYHIICQGNANKNKVTDRIEDVSLVHWEISPNIEFFFTILFP